MRLRWSVSTFSSFACSGGRFWVSRIRAEEKPSVLVCTDYSSVLSSFVGLLVSTGREPF